MMRSSGYFSAHSHPKYVTKFHAHIFYLCLTWFMTLNLLICITVNLVIPHHLNCFYTSHMMRSSSYFSAHSHPKYVTKFHAHIFYLCLTWFMTLNLLICITVNLVIPHHLNCFHTWYCLVYIRGPSGIDPSMCRASFPILCLSWRMNMMSVSAIDILRGDCGCILFFYHREESAKFAALRSFLD